jgi:predicted nucleotidyltransferase
VVDLPESDVELIRRWADETGAVRKVWIFGSRGKGVARPDSDVDIAIYLMPPGPAYPKWDWAYGDYLAKGDDWQGKLGRMLGRHVSPEAMIEGHPKESEILTGKQVWARTGS